MRYFILACLIGMSFLSQAYAKSEKQITAAQFGAVADDGKNDAEALRSAAAYCRTHPGTVFYIAPGVYDFKDNEAVRIEREAISGAYGRDDMAVQRKLFNPSEKYVRALDFNGCHNLTIKAEGATLRLYGWYEVISLVKTHNIHIEGLAIIYNRPPSTIGRITASTPEYFDMKIDPERYCYLDSIVTGRMHFFDAKRELIYFGGVKKKELLNPSTIRMYSTTQPAIGDYGILRHGGHYRPAIMIKESSDVELLNVKIFSHPGMGVVGHLSNNITLDGLQVVPEPGSVISTNTDATHFTSCSGKLVIRNSKFRGNGDDCTNIHNYYYCIYPESPKRVEIRIEDADLHAQSLDYPSVGDTMLVLSSKNMVEQGRYVVQKVHTSTAKWKVEIELNRPLQLSNPKDYYMTNLTRFPHVYIINNAVNCHMARAFLVKSPNVYIAGNCIVHSTHTAIKLGGELSWHEAGPTHNVVIENNYISGCGYAVAPEEASCIYTSTESPETPPCVNHDIIIRNNTFDTDKPNAIVLKDSEHVQILNNTIGHKDYVKQYNCHNIKVE